MGNTERNKKKRVFSGIAVVLAVAVLLGCFLLQAGCGSIPDDPKPTEEPVPTDAPGPTEEPVPTVAPVPTEEPAPTEMPGPPEIVNPVNGGTPEDLNETLRSLSEENGILVPGEDGYVYSDEDGDVTLTVTDPAEVQEALEAVAASGEVEDPSVFTGVIGSTGYIAVSTNGNVVVYITVGDQTVKAETDGKDGKADAKTAKKAASVAASAVTASKVKEPYERGRDDYDHNKAAYYMDAADCLIFYPAQLTKKTAFEDQSVIFSDARSSVSCSARLEFNPYKDIDELGSLIRANPNNTVLAWGDNWVTSEYIRDGMVTFTYVGLGKKYMVTEEICYPRKYSFVYDELRELMSVRFLEDGKWVNGNRKPKPKPEYGAPSYGLQERFYAEFELFLVIPDTLRETVVQGRRIVFHDDHRNSDVTVELFKIPEGEQDNLFSVFHVVAKEGDLFLGDDYIHWHNSNGMFLGAVSGSTAALMRFEGGDAFYAYEAVYDELICQLVDQYFEPQPLSGGNDEPTEGPLEPQPTAGPEETPEPQPTSGPSPEPTEGPLEPQPTAGPQPSPGPAGKKAPQKVEPNKIDKVVEKEVKEKAKEEYPPAPSYGNDPLEYYSDADCRAVNTTLEEFVDCYPSEEEMLLGVILKVLAYNGYIEAEWTDAEGLMLDLADLLEEIDDALFEFRLFGTDTGLPGDLFPYVCEALYMDQIPEYRIRPESDPPAPEWLEDLRENDYYEEEDLDWDEIRRILDQELPMPDFTSPDLDPGLFADGRTVPGGTEEPDGPDEPAEPDGPGGLEPGTHVAGPMSWPEYGVWFSEEEIEEMEEQVGWNYQHYLELAWEEDPAYWDQSAFHHYDDYLLRKEPDFGNTGWFSPYTFGLYETDVPMDGDPVDYVYHMAISEDGIWVLFDPDTGETLDYGILVPDIDGYGDLWYTVTADGEFMTLWEFDTGVLTTSKYGWLSHTMTEEQWEAYERHWDD